MPLSEEELRLLEQMERALVAEDPKFVSALRGTARRRDARRKTLVAGAVFVVGVVLLMAGAVMANTPLAVVGFVVMLGSAVVALSYWRSQGAAGAEPESPTATASPAGPGLSVLDGGKKSKRRPARPQSNGQTMMQRFEERWRRRRGSNGF